VSAFAFRPAQPNPVEQVPVLPVPQHGWPEPPQVPQLDPLVASMQASPVMQALTPPRKPAGKDAGEQGGKEAGEKTSTK